MPRTLRPLEDILVDTAEQSPGDSHMRGQANSRSQLFQSFLSHLSLPAEARVMLTGYKPSLPVPCSKT
jgi:hypothetical protein